MSQAAALDLRPFLPLTPSDVAVLHIRCGSDIYEGLQAAGIPGSFLEVSDPLCQGPLSSNHAPGALRRHRADVIASTYKDVGDAASVLQKLEGEAEGLEKLDRYAKIVLWFEHDLYDQAVLLRLLDELGGRPALHDRLFLITIDGFAGVDRFLGLGQLAPDQLAQLWGRETAITQAQFDDAAALWAAYSSGDPLALQDSLDTVSGALPFVRQALLRHLQELPWLGSGLGLTEQLTLTAIADGADTPGRVFARLMRDLDPQPYLGDAMFWPLLAGLARAPAPAVTAFSEWRDPIELTKLGRDLLDGECSWLDHARLDRWIGGLHLVGQNPPYLWDPQQGRAVSQPA